MRQKFSILVDVCVDIDLFLEHNVEKRIGPYIEEGIEEAFHEVARDFNVKATYYALEADEPC